MPHCQIFETEYTTGVGCSKNIHHRHSWHLVWPDTCCVISLAPKTMWCLTGKLHFIHNSTKLEAICRFPLTIWTKQWLVKTSTVRLQYSTMWGHLSQRQLGLKTTSVNVDSEISELTRPTWSAPHLGSRLSCYKASSKSASTTHLWVVALHFG